MNVVWTSKKHWMWFPISFTKYTITEDRFLKETGLLSTQYEETYLYRIIDVKLERTFLQKIFGTGSIVLYAADASQRNSVIKNIKDSFRVKEMLSKMVLEQRKSFRVREGSFMNLDMQDSDGDGFPDFI